MERVGLRNEHRQDATQSGIKDHVKNCIDVQAGSRRAVLPPVTHLIQRRSPILLAGQRFDEAPPYLRVDHARQTLRQQGSAALLGFEKPGLRQQMLGPLKFGAMGRVLGGG